LKANVRLVISSNLGHISHRLTTIARYSLQLSGHMPLSISD